MLLSFMTHLAEVVERYVTTDLGCRFGHHALDGVAFKRTGLNFEATGNAS